MSILATVEFNIFRRAADHYELAAVDGTVLDLDREGAILLLCLPGSRPAELPGLLAGFGLAEPDLAALDDLRGIGFLRDGEGPARRPYDLKQAVANVDAVSAGPLTLQELSITLSDACPLDCAYCFRKAGGAHGALTRREVAAAILDLRRLAGISLALSGGEPAAFADEVAYAAGFAREAGVRHISVNTSGVGLSAEILARWRREGIDTLNLSLDTLDPARSERLLGRGGAVDAARAALSAARAEGIAVHLNLTLSAGAAAELPDFAPLLRQPGLSMRVNPFVPLPGLAPVPPSEVRAAHAAVERMAAAGLPIYTPVDPDETYTPHFLCSGGITRATLENDGTMGGCQFLMGRHGPRGSVRDAGLYRLWIEGDFGPFRDGGRSPLGRCRACPDRPFCVSHCLAVHERMATDPDACPRGT